MIKTPNLQRRFLVALAVASAMPVPGWAQTGWKPPGMVRLVVPYPPGGSTDALARLLAEGLARELQQTVIVENRPGAATTIASAHVAGSAPDGKTLLITGPVGHVTAGLLYRGLKYDAVRSFEPITTLTSAPFVIAVSAESPYKGLGDLIAFAKKEPGKLTYGSTGLGGSAHLATEILEEAASARFLHIPYKGSGPAIIALIGREIDFAMVDVAVLPLIASGKLRGLAVTTARRSTLLPEMPTVREQLGIAFDEAADISLFAPAGTPATAVRAIAEASARVAREEAFKLRLTALGMEPAVGGPEQLGAQLKAINQRYGTVIRQLNLRLD